MDTRLRELQMLIKSGNAGLEERLEYLNTLRRLRRGGDAQYYSHRFGRCETCFEPEAAHCSMSSYCHGNGCEDHLYVCVACNYSDGPESYISQSPYHFSEQIHSPWDEYTAGPLCLSCANKHLAACNTIIDPAVPLERGFISLREFHNLRRNPDICPECEWQLLRRWNPFRF